MSKEVTLTVYEFAELDQQVKNKVLEEYRYTCVQLNDDWHQDVIEEFNDDMINFGISANVKFTGFGSQGDGASFTTDTCDTDLLIRKLYETGHDISETALLDSKNLSVHIERSGWNVHEYSMDVIVHDEDLMNDDERRKLEAVITEWARTTAHDLYKNLEKYFDELTSDEAVIEYFAENEFLFFSNGKVLSRGI